MKTETLQDLLNFSGALPEALFIDARRDVLDDAAQLVAFRRAQKLIDLVRAEIAPARAAVAQAQAEAEAAVVELRRLVAVCEEIAQTNDKDARLKAQSERDAARRHAQELRAASDAATKKPQHLSWLVESLETITHPETDALDILFNEVNSNGN